MALDECEMMTLDFENLEDIKHKYSEVYDELIFRVDVKYKKTHRLKINAIRDAKKNQFLGTIRTLTSMRTKNFELQKVLNKYQVMKNYVELHQIEEDVKDEDDSLKR